MPRAFKLSVHSVMILKMALMYVSDRNEHINKFLLKNTFLDFLNIGRASCTQEACLRRFFEKHSQPDRRRSYCESGQQNGGRAGRTSDDRRTGKASGEDRLKDLSASYKLHVKMIREAVLLFVQISGKETLTNSSTTDEQTEEATERRRQTKRSISIVQFQAKMIREAVLLCS